MKILLPALSSAASPDGVARHAVNVARCLAYQPEVERIDLVIGSWQQSCFDSLLTSFDPALRSAKLRVHRASCARPSLTRNAWYYRELPRLANTIASDLVHLTYPVPTQRARFGCPVLVTLHDLYPCDLPENFGYPRVLLNRLILRQCLTAADAISCVSKTTLERLRVRFPQHAQKTACIYNCVEPEPTVQADPVVPGRFVLMVAQHRKSKNIPLALSVFRRLLLSDPELSLLIVGNEGPETPGIQRMLDDQLLSGQVVLLRGITEPRLQWCYRNAELLLATSRIEGFGLPVVEAMLAGCPVVCSDIPAFREFGETHCHFVGLNASPEQAFLNAVRKVLRRGRAKPISLPHLSPSAVAARYMRVYASLLKLQPATMTLTQQMKHQTRGAA